MADVTIFANGVTVEVLSRPPAVPTVPTLVQGRLGDGLDGASRLAWNFGLELWWENIGVDWTDANGVAQGSVPYATATVGAVPGWTRLGVVALVRKHLAGLNTGMALRGLASGSTFASRNEPDASLRPVMRVTLADASVVACPCVANAQIDTASEMPAGNGTRVSLSSGFRLLLQFDYSAIPVDTTITAASLDLYAAQYGANATKFDVMDLRPPIIWTGDEPGDLDAASGGSPATLCDMQFTPDKYDPKRWTYAGVSYSIAATFGSSLDMGGGYLGTKFTNPDVFTDPGTGSPVGGGHCLTTLNPFFSSGAKWWLGPVHQPGIDEIYSLATVKLGTNWPPTADGGKLPPSVAGRYGVQGKNADPLSWWAVGGNGQDATDGKMHALGEVGGNPAWYQGSAPNAPPSTPVLLGWSVRSSFTKRVLPDNPYYSANLTALRAYLYWAKMPLGTGANKWGMSGQVFRIGRVCLKRDKAYPIEIHAKMNSIDLSAPDALGNGIGRDDGVLEYRVCGVKHTIRDYKTPRQPITGICYRQHPDIHIDEPMWEDYYHGGGPMAAENCDMQIGRCAASAQPITP